VEAGKAHPQVYPLPFGDYWIRSRRGGLVSVERKHGDLAADWPWKLSRQFQKALDNKVEDVVLLVEGLLPTLYTNGKLLAGQKERGLWYDQVWSTLLRWQIEKNIRIYPCHEGSAHVARALLSIQRYYRRE
jgi:hypothetical protein